MSIVKDFWLFLPIVISIYFFIKYLCLKQDLKKERCFFINTLAHDFRVAVLAQKRGLEILNKELAPDKKQDCILQNIIENSQYTLDMVSVLISSYKHLDGEITCFPEYVNLNKLLSEVFDLNEHKMQEKNIKYDFDSVKYPVFCDKISITKAFLILISTLISYSVFGSIIKCGFKESKNKLKIILSYTGQALSFEEQARMFCKNTIYSSVGEGLRMYLCRKIIELNNGKINFYNKNDKNFFEIILPLCNRQKKQNILFTALFPVRT